MSDDGLLLDTFDVSRPSRIHVVGVGGTGMGSFAGMLRAAGHQVTGSDENVYPPMSDMLEAWGLKVMTPYAAGNLDLARPDLVIIGNVIRRGNPEATAVRERRLPQMSFPAALGAFFLASRHPVVVAGTHGKTTTSALMAHALVSAGLDPSFLVGGVTQNYAGNFRLGGGPHFVVEGDEYDTAYFDKGPKFLHYRTRTLILTSVELDHADIYRDLEHYQAAFAALVAQVPDSGTVAVSASWPDAVRLAKAGRARVVTYSAREDVEAEVRAAGLAFGPDGARFEVHEAGQAPVPVQLPLGGRHNVENALGVWAAGRSLGLSAAALAGALSTFRGVKRRQEVRGEPAGVLVIDDFAHHPTAVRETVAAVRARYPGRRLWALFEPRSNTSRRNLHQAAYALAFEGASRASVKVPEPHDKIPPGEELDVPRLAAELSRAGVPASAAPSVEALVAEVTREAQRGDVLLVMSNGSFGGLIPKVLEALGRRTV
jgi:UDP-N-acetylmuramate: L-alanyl-gamma-D-glutamyl-meso-diaminopimelate ligase